MNKRKNALEVTKWNISVDHQTYFNYLNALNVSSQINLGLMCTHKYDSCLIHVRYT